MAEPEKRHDAERGKGQPADTSERRPPAAPDAHRSPLSRPDASERREGRARRRERTRREELRLKLGDSSQLKRETFYALENLKRASWPARIVGGALFVLIVLNAVVVFVSAQPGLDPVASNVIQAFYKFSTVCFCIEYLGRLWVADLAYGDCSPARARLRYAVSAWGIIDFLSFAPNMVAWFVPMTAAVAEVIAVVRLVRLVKISRYMRGLRTIGRVVAKHYREIAAAFFVIAMLVVVSSVVMYQIEHPAQPDKFNNLLSGVYWAVTTVTGTGYGDLVPITPAGRIVGSIIMILSVALVAIPGGIFSAGFVAEFQNANLRKIERDVRREDARQDDRDEEERVEEGQAQERQEQDKQAEEERGQKIAAKSDPSPTQRDHK